MKVSGLMAPPHRTHYLCSTKLDLNSDSHPQRINHWEGKGWGGVACDRCAEMPLLVGLDSQGEKPAFGAHGPFG